MLSQCDLEHFLFTSPFFLTSTTTVSRSTTSRRFPPPMPTRPGGSERFRTHDYSSGLVNNRPGPMVAVTGGKIGGSRRDQPRRMPLPIIGSDDFAGGVGSTMGFELRAVIGQDAALREWKRTFPSLGVCRLSGDLRLVPHTSRLAVEMRTWLAAGGIPLRAGSAENQVNEAGWRTHRRACGWPLSTPWTLGTWDTRTTPSGPTGSRSKRQAPSDPCWSISGKQVGLDPGPGFDIGTYRGESAAEKWAAEEAVD